MKTKQDVLRTAQKLANLTEDNGATPGEAAVAAEKLQQLLIDHNLEIAEILNSPDQTKRPKIITLRIPLTRIDGTIKWQREFIFGIARYTFCQALGLSKTAMMLVGRESDIQATKEIIDYLFLTLQQIAADTYKREGYGNPVHWRTGFYWGATREIIQRFYQQWRKAQTASPADPLKSNTTMNAIVLVTHKDIEDFISTTFTKVGSFKQKARQGDFGARVSGRAAGASIPLGPSKKLSEGSHQLKS